MIYIETGSTDVYYNFGLEYYFAAEKKLPEPVLLFWRTTPTLMVGKYQNILEEINKPYADAHGIHLVRRMSGGNVQKVLVGREIAQQPAVLMTAYAVRGLDINTSYTIYNLLTEQKMRGVAVVYVGEDLDVLLELCDRIVVLCGGQVSGVVDARTTDKRQIGALMTLVNKGGKADE